MEYLDKRTLYTRQNLLEDRREVSIEEYYKVYGSRIIQQSERLFLEEFLYPILGKKNIKYVIPQYPFIDSEGKLRRIDFAIIKDDVKIALEVNGETYHAEGMIPNDRVDFTKIFIQSITRDKMEEKSKRFIT